MNVEYKSKFFFLLVSVVPGVLDYMERERLRLENRKVTNWVCKICGYSGTKSHTTDHMYSNHAIREHLKCSACGKLMYTNRVQYRKHVVRCRKTNFLK